MNLNTALKLEFAEPKTLPFDFLSYVKPPAKANRESELSSNLIDRLIEYSREKATPETRHTLFVAPFQWEPIVLYILPNP